MASAMEQDLKSPFLSVKEAGLICGSKGKPGTTCAGWVQDRYFANTVVAFTIISTNCRSGLWNGALSRPSCCQSSRQPFQSPYSGGSYYSRTGASGNPGGIAGAVQSAAGERRERAVEGLHPTQGRLQEGRSGEGSRRRMDRGPGWFRA